MKDKALYVYYQIDVKTGTISLVKCTFDYNGLPVIPEELKKEVAYIPKNKMNEIVLRVPLKKALFLSNETGKIIFLKRIPLEIEKTLTFTTNPNEEEITNIAIILREAATKLRNELRIKYEITSERISIDKRSNNPLGIITIKKTIKPIKKKSGKRKLKKLLYKMLYSEYINIINSLNTVGPMKMENVLTLK